MTDLEIATLNYWYLGQLMRKGILHELADPELFTAGGALDQINLTKETIPQSAFINRRQLYADITDAIIMGNPEDEMYEDDSVGGD